MMVLGEGGMEGGMGGGCELPGGGWEEGRVEGGGGEGRRGRTLKTCAGPLGHISPRGHHRTVPGGAGNIKYIYIYIYIYI